MTTPHSEFQSLSERALEFISDGSVVGLGSGRAATAFIHVLGDRVAQGFRIRGVATSEASAALAKRLGIPLVSLEDVEAVDVDVDGADEVDPHGNLIKGLGGALVREKIVAASARKIIVVVGAEKLVPVLGSHGTLPLEVIPFGVSLVSRQLLALGLSSIVRLHDGKPFVSDNGDYILDAHIQPLLDPHELERAIRAIPGVVGTGLFLGMKPIVLIQHGDRVEVREPDEN